MVYLKGWECGSLIFEGLGKGTPSTGSQSAAVGRLYRGASRVQWPQVPERKVPVWASGRKPERAPPMVQCRE